MSGKIRHASPSEGTATDVPLMFIPYPLVVPGKPHLRPFPRNVMFGTIIGPRLASAALYQPDVTSFKVQDKGASMTYHNVLDRRTWLSKFSKKKNSWLEMNCETERDGALAYTCVKFVRGREVGMAMGRRSSLEDEQGWSHFFAQLTLLGVSEDEPHKLIDVPPQEASGAKSAGRQD